MDISELESYNLKDAVRFHNRLNPKLWRLDEHLLPEVRDALLQIASDFQEFLGVSNLEVADITLSGSNAAYAYTTHSDIDLHLVVNIPESADEVYRELFNAKKYQYNESHNIKVRGYDVELYVQPADEPHISQGIYSVKNNKWIDVPKRKRARIDDASVIHKTEDIAQRIEQAVSRGRLEQINSLIDKIKDMRQSGLEHRGEFSTENLVFKILRNNGLIKRLYDARTKAQDIELSLKEREKAVPKEPVVYGFKSITQEAPLSSPDGVSPSTCMFTDDAPVKTNVDIVKEFFAYCVTLLKIANKPALKLHRDPEWSRRNKSFGSYDPDIHGIHLSLSDRHIMDILRTLAHELVHAKQHEATDVPSDAGTTGSSFENEANAKAGILMRQFADMHPEFFSGDAIAEARTQKYSLDQFDSWAQQYAGMYSVPIEVVRHVMQTETGWMKNADRQARARSPAGAIGVMQLMPNTAKSLGVKNIKDPQQNIEAGVRYLSQLLSRYKDPAIAMAAYNWGPTNVDRWRQAGANMAALPKETQNYVAAYMPKKQPVATGHDVERPGFGTTVRRAGEFIQSIVGIKPAKAGEVGGNNQHTVQAGDTLSKIAQANQIDLATLQAANPQIKNPNLIQNSGY